MHDPWYFTQYIISHFVCYTITCRATDTQGEVLPRRAWLQQCAAVKSHMARNTMIGLKGAIQKGTVFRPADRQMRGACYGMQACNRWDQALLKGCMRVNQIQQERTRQRASRSRHRCKERAAVLQRMCQALQAQPEESMLRWGIPVVL